MGRQEPQGLSIEGSVHDQAVYLNQVTAAAIGSTYFGQYAIWKLNNQALFTRPSILWIVFIRTSIDLH